MSHGKLSFTTGKYNLFHARFTGTSDFLLSKPHELLVVRAEKMQRSVDAVGGAD